MTLEEIRLTDPKGMYRWILDFPTQVEEAVRIGTACNLRLGVRGVRNIVLTGLGGSAIGGDLLRSYLAEDLKVPFLVNRHYNLPKFVGRDSLVIVSSYSGNTEETISAHREATKRKSRVLCISTGGTTEQLARKFKQMWIQIPPGLSPRAALGYSFFPLLIALSRLKFIKARTRDVKETIALLKLKGATYGDPGAPGNRPLQLAQLLKGKLPVVYSATEHLDAINLRWRGQIAENAKQLSHGHVLPEMNHNELVGWKCVPDLMKNMHVVFLKDSDTHRRVTFREDITKQVVSRYAGGVTEIASEGTSLLARMFSLVQFGDWVSFYLAVLNREDPEPVDVIDYLKHQLAKMQ